MISFISPVTGDSLKSEGDFLISAKGEKFPIVKGIPRFVPENNYAAAFGLQWHTFSKTQIDSFNNLSLTKERLERCLGFPLNELKGKTLLEIGCGAGRFTELFANAGANVYAVDLSNAIEVNKENHASKGNVVFAQASIEDLPFQKESFDVVICLGVIQHTPSPERTIKNLWAMTSKGGMVVIDHYRWRLSYYFNAKPLWRHWLRILPPEKSMAKVKSLVEFFFPLHWKFRNNKIASWLLHRISPLIEYIHQFPEQDYNWHFELSFLDSYDSLTDYYKHLRTEKSIYNTLKKLGASQIHSQRGGNGVEARAIKL